MKTQKTSNPPLPSPVKFSIYLLVVAAICFLNWNALKASDSDNGEAKTLEARLEAALVPVVEADIELEDWMLNIADEVAVESEIILEAWMLNEEAYQFAESAETQIALEDWMLEVDGSLFAENTEPEIALEDWMLTFSENLVDDSEESEIVLADWMLTVPDPAPELEDWMVDAETWAQIEFLAKK